MSRPPQLSSEIRSNSKWLLCDQKVCRAIKQNCQSDYDNEHDSITHDSGRDIKNCFSSAEYFFLILGLIVSLMLMLFSVPPHSRPSLFPSLLIPTSSFPSLPTTVAAPLNGQTVSCCEENIIEVIRVQTTRCQRRKNQRLQNSTV